PPTTTTVTRPLHDALPISHKLSSRVGTSTPRPARLSIASILRPGKFSRGLPHATPRISTGPLRLRGPPSAGAPGPVSLPQSARRDRKSTRLNSSHVKISYA